MEKILNIKETSFTPIDKTNNEYGRTFDGFIIVTTNQEIRLGIENDQMCCEDWGYFLSEDNFDKYIGSTLYTVEIVDEQLKNYTILKDVYIDSVMFVNIKTSEGLLQFVAYNNHNGYYGHSSCVISRNMVHYDVL